MSVEETREADDRRDAETESRCRSFVSHPCRRLSADTKAHKNLITFLILFINRFGCRSTTDNTHMLTVSENVTKSISS